MNQLKLEDALFPVEQRQVFLHNHKPSDETLFDDNLSGGRFEQIKRYQAIVNTKNNYVFSVVANDYKLVTNKEALEMGRQCFKEIFSITDIAEMEFFNLIMPLTSSFCHIDFKHSQREFEPWQNDKWVPFMRITNSYNRTKLLRFDIGFCRYICKNGVIFDSKKISFRYTHTKGNIPNIVALNTSAKQFKEFEIQFVERLHNLQRYHVPPKYMFPLLCRVLDIHFTKEDFERPKRSQQLFDFSEHTQTLTDEYFNIMGQNGYAALNVISDFASRPNLYISPESRIDRLQKRTGNWIGEFIQEIQNKDFNFENYLGPYIEQCKLIQKPIFDKEFYNEIKPALKQMYDSTIGLGKDAADFIDKVIQNIGVESKLYVMQFVKDLKKESNLK